MTQIRLTDGIERIAYRGFPEYFTEMARNKMTWDESREYSLADLDLIEIWIRKQLATQRSLVKKNPWKQGPDFLVRREAVMDEHLEFENYPAWAIYTGEDYKRLTQASYADIVALEDELDAFLLAARAQFK